MLRARDNPFASERLHALRFRLRGVTWEGLLERFAALGHRGSLVGPEGSGKTTLLGALLPRFRELGFNVRQLRLTRDQPRFQPPALDELWRDLGSHDLILLDGAEQLGPLRWRGFLRRTRPAGGLLITLHRAGRLPTLLECGTSPELLDELVADLLGELTPAARRRNRELFQRHAGNLRLVLRDWYDCCAAGTEALDR
ncbi:MAG: hypothetical protein KDM81_02600 [Verrucomicrobiae bacterium]|nr:hypothetical protein [Verrucomicrobiae bacterium]MCP5521920.1 hypothetical protein [Verrucomicrobiales bacterium]